MPDPTCKLTGERGTFVKAHLIPKALTRPSKSGLPFVQGGQGSRPIRRWTSWYDDSLVTRAGEDILTALDTWAIRELRRHELVWSGWGPTLALSTSHTQLPGTAWGVRDIEGIDPRMLRLFFLSLLWRAAATKRTEFSDVVLPPDDMEKLRLMLVDGNPEPLSFYPAQLIQLSTIGPVHNYAPLLRTKVISAAKENQPERNIPIFRFYFDGLVAHIQKQASDEGYTEGLGCLVVGRTDRLTVSTVTYETSFQRDALDHIKAEASRLWPGVVAKL